MLRRNIEVTDEQLDRAYYEAGTITIRQKELARKIYNELTPEQIAEEGVTVNSIFKIIEAMEYAIDAGAAKIWGYATSTWDGVEEYRVDNALGLV